MSSSGIDSQVSLSQLMKGAGPEFHTKLVDQLQQISALLTCPICDAFFQNPIGLQCGHRFCEKCIKDLRDEGNFECPTCRKQSKSKAFRAQTHLKLYIINFKKLITFLVSQTSSVELSQLNDFLNFGKKFSELKSPDNSENCKENEEDELDKTANEHSFMPQLYSTSVKARNSLKNRFVNLENSTIFAERGNIVDETMEEYEDFHEKIDETTDSVEETVVAPKMDTSPAIENNEDLDFSSDETQLDDLNDITTDSQENPMKSFEIDDALMLAEGSAPNFSLSDDDENYQTQSQIPLLKPSITYSHKSYDKFDRVVQNSEKSMKSETNKVSESTRDNVSIRYNRSESPDLLGSDDSLLDFP